MTDIRSHRPRGVAWSAIVRHPNRYAGGADYTIRSEPDGGAVFDSFPQAIEWCEKVFAELAAERVPASLIGASVERGRWIPHSHKVRPGVVDAAFEEDQPFHGFESFHDTLRGGFTWQFRGAGADPRTEEKR